MFILAEWEMEIQVQKMGLIFGKGFIHLTGKKQYKEFNRYLMSKGMANDYKGILSTMWFWEVNELNNKIPSNIDNNEDYEIFTNIINKSSLDWKTRRNIARSLLENFKN